MKPLLMCVLVSLSWFFVAGAYGSTLIIPQAYESNDFAIEFPFDINADGINDYRIAAGGIYSEHEASFVAGLWRAPGLEFLGALTLTFVGGDAVHSTQLASGYAWIKRPYTGDGKIGVFPELYLSYGVDSLIGTGEWFAGLRLDLQDGPHFGWLHLFTQEVGPGLRTLATGFETIPNQRMFTPVPEPAFATGVLSAGVMMVLRRRRSFRG